MAKWRALGVNGRWVVDYVKVSQALWGPTMTLMIESVLNLSNRKLTKSGTSRALAIIAFEYNHTTNGVGSGLNVTWEGPGFSTAAHLTDVLYIPNEGCFVRLKATCNDYAFMSGNIIWQRHLVCKGLHPPQF
ncbi:predicted protein [Histoplasma mississippiense (nom. inval.)]|uniref:predicted protein n=1 Tax=Ajellomyces capsulatus (strain NAm1 / WU24) TaxID=2059318 RepID=UPI000157B719|nr:predicted protein [Histoplasma mississippiense (nom. inval.)]EDN03412.1 predicted protein [Histoplasma mississippiense (nom. inval.)]